MPLVTLTTSAAAPSDAQTKKLLQDLSATTARLIGKPEAYVMTSFAPRASMTFAGSPEPACLVEVKSIGGLKSDVTGKLTASICALVHEALGVPTNRVYLVFADVPAHLWGFDGATFG